MCAVEQRNRVSDANIYLENERGVFRRLVNGGTFELKRNVMAAMLAGENMKVASWTMVTIVIIKCA